MVNENANSKELAIDDFTPEDLIYEEELLRYPFSLQMWWRYLEAKKDADESKRDLLYFRALRKLPGSYKLWAAFLRERQIRIRGCSPDSPQIVAMNNLYKRALVTMHKMPRIWIWYLEHMMSQHRLTETRREFDRSLRSLAVTQHDRIWQLYLKFATMEDMPILTGSKIYNRYIRYEPTHAEEYILYLKTKGLWGEAAKQLSIIVNDHQFRSLEGKSRHQLWLELCDLITKYANDMKDIKVDAIIRAGIRLFTDEVGKLWISLANYYVQQNMIEMARDVYEEGLSAVTTVRDFSLIFDTLTHLEESIISIRLLQQQEEGGDEAADAAAAAAAAGAAEDFMLKDEVSDLDMRLARLDFLISRRPELLSSVMLRQNPHNVHEWHKRVRIFDGKIEKQIQTYAEAITTVDPFKATGKYFTLWTSFARFYERYDNLDSARAVFERAINATYKYLDDLASVWCEYVEMELRMKRYKNAHKLLQRATSTPEVIDRNMREAERVGPVQNRLYRSSKLWSLYCDLEESLGTVQSTNEVYDRVFELRVATPQMVINYAAFLQENKYFEQSFSAYEKGLSLFKWPHNKDIWTIYLQQFVDRYGGSKIERARDLFKQAIQAAVKTVPLEDRLSIYQLYVERAQEFIGLAKVREVYETAIEGVEPYQLSDRDTQTLSLQYARLEEGLGEVDRARAILVHAAGEMRRIKRSVETSFAKVHFNSAAVGLETDVDMSDPMAGLDALMTDGGPPASETLPGFVSGGVVGQEKSASSTVGGDDAAAGGGGGQDVHMMESEDIDID